MRKNRNILFIFLSTLTLSLIVYGYTLIQVNLPKVKKELEANFTFRESFGVLHLKNFTFNFTSNLVKFDSLKRIKLYNVSITNKALNLTAKEIWIDNKSFIIFKNLTSYFIP